MGQGKIKKKNNPHFNTLDLLQNTLGQRENSLIPDVRSSTVMLHRI